MNDDISCWHWFWECDLTVISDSTMPLSWCGTCVNPDLYSTYFVGCLPGMCFDLLRLGLIILKWPWCRLTFVALSAVSLPCNPTWLGIHRKITDFLWSASWFILRTAVITDTLSDIVLLHVLLTESVKMWRWFSSRRRAWVKVVLMAFNSACREDDPLLILLLMTRSLNTNAEPTLLE